ncbi:hypothetical protein KAU19_05755 [Candidatus Parcubacteria bacterium]|nr:hypothetical protein [Candidatus Parcubacteria bacterium]
MLNIEKTTNPAKSSWLFIGTRLSIIIGVLIISFSVFYYLVVLPENSKKDLDNCLKEAKEKYNQEWKESCRYLGEELDEDGSCETLPSESAYWLRENYMQLMDKCFKQYPQ